MSVGTDDEDVQLSKEEFKNLSDDLLGETDKVKDQKMMNRFIADSHKNLNNMNLSTENGNIFTLVSFTKII